MHVTEGRFLLIRATILKRNRYRIPKCKECIATLSELLKYSVLKICDQIVKKRFVGNLFDSAFSNSTACRYCKTRYFIMPEYQFVLDHCFTEDRLQSVDHVKHPIWIKSVAWRGYLKHLDEESGVVGEFRLWNINLECGITNFINEENSYHWIVMSEIRCIEYKK